MKKTIFLSVFLLISSNFLFSQVNIFPINTPPNNVGIGTITPLEKLHVQNGNLLFAGNNVGNALMGTIKFSTTSFPQAYSGIAGSTNGVGLDQLDLLFFTAYGAASEKMRLMASTGYLGIGTSSPLARLDVRGAAIFGSNKKITLNPDYAGTGELPSGAFIGINGPNSLALAPSTDVASSGAKIVLGYKGTTWWSAVEVANVASGYSNLLLMKSGGNVGLGTSTPQAKLDVNGNIYSNGKVFIGIPDGSTTSNIANYSLAVDGSALFTKAVVKLKSSWPDYVFHADYKLPRLSEIESFIKQNGHLPEMPTAADIEKNGIDLGENQASLLKKIEELTLILIELEKKVEKLENGVNK